MEGVLVEGDVCGSGGGTSGCGDSARDIVGFSRRSSSPGGVGERCVVFERRTKGGIESDDAPSNEERESHVKLNVDLSILQRSKHS